MTLLINFDPHSDNDNTGSISSDLVLLLNI